MFHRRHVSRMSVLGFVGSLLFAGCSASERTQPLRGAGLAESANALSPDALIAKVLRVTTTGELCPPFAGERAEISSTFEKVSLGTGHPPECDPNSPTHEPVRQSLTPSCTVTLELEVPQGFRVGTPIVRWAGYLGGPGGNAKRSYSFSNGESFNASSNTLRGDDNFSIDDLPQPAFSTCSESNRVTLTAKFEASVADDPTSYLQLDGVEIGTAWRQGLDFKNGCSPGELVEVDPAAALDWCGGPHHRGCEIGLACDVEEIYSPPGGPEVAEGRCVDPTEPGHAGALREDCDGSQNLECEPGLVCWHLHGKKPNWRGECVAQVADVGDRCGVGIPQIACRAPLVCYQGRCAEPQAHEDQGCVRDGLPSCVAPLVCDRTYETCRRPSGEEGDDCGSNLPACQQPMYCEGGQCVDPRGGAGAPCNDTSLDCKSRFACVGGTCVIDVASRSSCE